MTLRDLYEELDASLSEAKIDKGRTKKALGEIGDFLDKSGASHKLMGFPSTNGGTLRVTADDTEKVSADLEKWLRGRGYKEIKQRNALGLLSPDRHELILIRRKGSRMQVTVIYLYRGYGK